MKNCLTKHRLGMLLFSAFVASAALFTSSCNKGTTFDVPQKTETKARTKSDSVYFEIAGKSYSGEPDLRGMNKVVNSGYRKKYQDGPKEGMTIYDQIGPNEKGWYAATDSIYFTCANTYKIGNYGNLEISFSQGFPKNNMNRYGAFYFPKDTRNILKKGKLSFATDYESTNFENGVSISFASYGRTGKPEFAFNESLSNYSQGDSVFEIINTEQIDNESYFVEARFELNLYDNSRSKHRVTNGYIRFTLKKGSVWGNFYQ